MPSELNYLKGLVICHGKSELCLTKYVCSNLHLNIKTYAKKNGENSIQITSLLDLINSKPFKTMRDFTDQYMVEKSHKQLNNFKLFTIMDTDDCTDEEKNRYISKEMFKKHWLYPYIEPIFNITNLEDVLLKSKIIPKRVENKDKGTYYFKIFPINKKPLGEDTVLQVNELNSMLTNNNKTNGRL